MVGRSAVRCVYVEMRCVRKWEKSGFLIQTQVEWAKMCGINRTLVLAVLTVVGSASLLEYDDLDVTRGNPMAEVRHNLISNEVAHHPYV